MLKATLEVICDNCKGSIIVPSGVFIDHSKPVFCVVDTTPQWEFVLFSELYSGNVIIHDVEQWLEDAGWKTNLEEEPIIECPTCKEVE